jgi:opacity protein-like surface antigen
MSEELTGNLRKQPRGACAALAVLLCVALPSSAARAWFDESQPRSPWSLFAGFSSHAFAEAGFHLGGEYALLQGERFESMLHLAVQAYGFGASETGYALQLRWGQRYTAPFGLTLESYLGVGAQYSLWENTVITFMDSRGRATTETRTGVSIIPHVMFGPGYDLSRLFAIPLHVYARAGLLLLYPDMNEVFHLSAVAELGLRWTP